MSEIGCGTTLSFTGGLVTVFARMPDIGKRLIEVWRHGHEDVVSQDPSWRQLGDPAGGVVDAVRAGHQPRDRQGTRADDLADALAAGGSGHRVGQPNSRREERVC